MKPKILYLSLLASATCLALFFAAAPAALTDNQGVMAKIDPLLAEAFSSGNEAEFLVYLEQQANLSKAAGLLTKEERGQFVFKELLDTSISTQRTIISSLERKGIEYRPFWIANMILVRGGEKILVELANRSDVHFIYANPETVFHIPATDAAQPLALVDSIPWNISSVGADEAWSLGVTGEGVVIGGQDTGYEWSHPALINQYRGWDGNTADHSYNWHDAIHLSANTICAPDSPAPCDDYGHGTHTMGIAVGDDGNGHQIGVAPGARWIGCRNMDQGAGTPASYAECYQWFLAPTDLNDNNPDPSKAPDIINNSWSCPATEGCTDPAILQLVVENVRAAGILPVHSAGNSGSGCFSISTAAAIYDASFTVGATNAVGVIATFSSRGPVKADGSYRLKPDISAPGFGVTSSVLNGAYGAKSGTSMAAPHVAGMAALAISDNPQLRGNPDNIESFLNGSAVPVQAIQSCGEIPGEQIPNNTYGYGIINFSKQNSALENQYFAPLVQSS